jgi:radical SAM superfamily enzyme YgiQ (UPF0313 family)
MKPSPGPPQILLVNPWIHDFAAYDFWAAPLGLLSLGGVLRHHGFRVSYINCLERFHPRAPSVDPASRNGRGPYLKTKIPPPKGLEDVPRTFSRYGIPPEWLREDLKELPKPDLVLVTSLMTYWYPGVQETVRELRAAFPSTPIVLGGIYATLCRDHAEAHSGADRVVTDGSEHRILDIVAEFTGFSTPSAMDPEDLDSLPYPALDLQRRVPYLPLLTSRGCPFSCAYCASAFLSPRRQRRSPSNIIEEISHWNNRLGIIDIAFYDDALLVDADAHAVPMFENIISRGMKVRFHTPNALHIRNISSRVAKLMHRAGFHTLRLGLETARFHDRQNLDAKVTEAEFRQAVAYLLEAGFQKNQVGAYLLMGLPDQSVSDVKSSIELVKNTGITPILAHYTPIPHTRMWPAAVAASRYDLVSDPIFTNNALWPCRPEGFSWHTMTELKRLAAG